jgi:hypothetical protein
MRPPTAFAVVDMLNGYCQLCAHSLTEAISYIKELHDYYEADKKYLAVYLQKGHQLQLYKKDKKSGEYLLFSNIKIFTPMTEGE